MLHVHVTTLVVPVSQSLHACGCGQLAPTSTTPTGAAPSTCQLMMESLHNGTLCHNTPSQDQPTEVVGAGAAAKTPYPHTPIRQAAQPGPPHHSHPPKPVALQHLPATCPTHQATLLRCCTVGSILPRAQPPQQQPQRAPAAALLQHPHNTKSTASAHCRATLPWGHAGLHQQPASQPASASAPKAEAPSM